MKSTKAEMLKRVEAVYRVILLGGEFHDIREYADSEDPPTTKKPPEEWSEADKAAEAARKRPWEVSDTTLREYQRKAHDLFKKRVERDREKIFARHLLARRALYARAVESGDWRAALAIARDEAELEGLYPQKRSKEKPIEEKGRLEDLLANPEARKLLQEYHDWEPPMLTVTEPAKEKQA